MTRRVDKRSSADNITYQSLSRAFIVNDAVATATGLTDLLRIGDARFALGM